MSSTTRGRGKITIQSEIAEASRAGATVRGSEVALSGTEAPPADTPRLEESSRSPSLRELLSWLTRITRPVHKPLYVSTFFRILNLTLDVLLFALAGGGLTAVVVGNASALPILAGLVLIALIKASAYYLEQLTGHYVAFKALELLRTAVFSQLWPKAPAIVTHSRSGDVLASLTRDVDRIEVVYAHTFAPVVSACVVPAALLVTTGAIFGWNLVAIPALCMAIALFVVPFVGFGTSMRATRRTLAERRELTHHLTDSVFGAEEVVSYGRTADRLAQTDALSEHVGRLARIPRTFAALRRAANLALMLISAIAVSWTGIETGQSIVLVAALASGSLRLYEGPRGVEDAAGYLDHSFAAARRLWDMSHSPEAVSDGACELKLEASPDVTFENISYAYTDSEGKETGFALSGIGVHVPSGSHTVFVGPSGSGKSTTVQMLLRYDDPHVGRVLIDGTPVSDYTLDSLRHAVVAVSQKSQLLASTIRANLVLGAPEASEDEIWKVLTEVHLDEEVRAMPKGLDTQIGHGGAGLSGGQAQRLCLARALLMKPRVLVLDEFTANLNVELEREIRADIAAALPGVTLIEVTHRLESAREADQVIMLDRGQIVAQGSPSDSTDERLRALFTRDV